MGPVEVVKIGLRAIGLGPFIELYEFQAERLRQLVQNFGRFVQDPPRYIVAMLVAVALTVTTWVSNFIETVISLFQWPATVLGNALSAGVGQLASELLLLVTQLNQTAVETAVGTGPVAPFAVFALFVAEMLALYFVLSLLAPQISSALATLVGVIRG